MSLSPQFGGKYQTAHGKEFQRSPQWNGKKFENLEETAVDINFWNLPGLIKEQLTNRSGRVPREKIEVLPFDQPGFNAGNAPKFVWYGHSALLLQINGKNLLIDPMLGPNASPIAPFKTKRFTHKDLQIIDDLPAIDAVMMTHDHYDHLDLASIRKLKSKVKQWFVGLGIGRHLIRWGIPADQIQEFAWWENTTFGDVQITYTPSRHFSGRGAFDSAKSLWGGWVFQSADHKIYWSGDGGYGDHFKDIGQKMGPFDWGFMECGQYNKLWHRIHMFPEESILAAQDTGVKTAIPVHWAGFSLALHHWKEPIERFVAKAEEVNHSIICPRVGEVITLGGEYDLQKWWEKLN